MRRSKMFLSESMQNCILYSALDVWRCMIWRWESAVDDVPGSTSTAEFGFGVEFIDSALDVLFRRWMMNYSSKFGAGCLEFGAGCQIRRGAQHTLPFFGVEDT